MSDTKVDMPKIAQMLDSGWSVFLFKGAMGSYEVRAKHEQPRKMQAARDRLIESQSQVDESPTSMTPSELVDLCHFDDDQLMTDDFTPEQALTRMAYKVFGEVI